MPTSLQEMEVIYYDGKKIKLRWEIEQMFQKVTQVFNLRTLIGSSPQATVFQTPFCLLLYNMIQVMRAYIAEGQESKVKEISIENLFYDVPRQLIAWHEVLSVEATVGLLSTTWTAAQVANRLRQLLHGQWSECWRKTPSNTHRASPKTTYYLKGGHNSVYRLIQWPVTGHKNGFTAVGWKPHVKKAATTEFTKRDVSQPALKPRRTSKYRPQSTLRAAFYATLE